MIPCKVFLLFVLIVERALRFWMLCTGPVFLFKSRHDGALSFPKKMERLTVIRCCRTAANAERLVTSSEDLRVCSRTNGSRLDMAFE